MYVCTYISIYLISLKADKINKILFIFPHHSALNRVNSHEICIERHELHNLAANERNGRNVLSVQRPLPQFGFLAQNVLFLCPFSLYSKLTYADTSLYHWLSNNWINWLIMVWQWVLKTAYKLIHWKTTSPSKVGTLGEDVSKWMR